MLNISINLKTFSIMYCKYQNNGLVQEYSNSIINAMELLQYCTKPLKYAS